MTSFDGVELTVQLAKIDGEPWALLDARAVEALAPPAPAAAAATGAAGGRGGGAQPPAEVRGRSAVRARSRVTPDRAPPRPTRASSRRVSQPWAFKISSQLFERLTRPRSEWLEDSGTS